MLKPCVVAFVEDLRFRSILEEATQRKSVECYFAGRGEQLSQLAKSLNPFLFIVDLSSVESEWLFKHIALIKFARSSLTVVAIVNSDDEQIRNRAESYGCDLTVSKEDFAKATPDTIERALRKA